MNLTKKHLDEIKEYDYAYPYGLDLKPGSDLHEFIRKAILERADESFNVMSTRYGAWAEIDRTLTAYIPTDKYGEDIDDDEDEYVRPPIVIPLTYAVKETILTYMVAAFFESPIFRYKGVGGEDEIKAILLEKVIETHVIRSKVALKLYTMMSDSLSYGLGCVSPVWVTEKGYKRESFSAIIETEKKKRRREAVLFEGNDLINIDPYKAILDPTIASYDVKKAEFVGWLDRTNFVGLMRKENDDKTIFNVQYLKDIAQNKSQYWSETYTGRYDKSGQAEDIKSNVLRPVDLIYMYIDLIPNDWNLSNSKRPEKWFFILAGDKIIIKAQKVDLDHNRFPLIIDSPDYDGRQSTPISPLEVIYGLQEYGDFLLNSHSEAVVSGVGNSFIVDPFLINVPDLYDKSPKKIIRLQRAAWGRGVEACIKQLDFNDITRQHIQEIPFLKLLCEESTGAVDLLKGLRRQTSERVTATEASSIYQSALSRLEKRAKLSAIQSFYDIGYMFAKHLQQFMTEDTYVRIAGEMEEALKKEYGINNGMAKVTPFDVDIDFDVIVQDGTVPGSTDTQTWTQLFQIISTQPDLKAQFDMVRIFKHIARGLGAKNVEQFTIKVQSDEQVNRQVTAGNLIPAQNLGLPKSIMLES